MHLILAHRHDPAARRLASLWGDAAVLLTPADLHAERLLLLVDRRGQARAELRSRPRPRAVLCRLGAVRPGDLEHADPRDAGYAAAELDAFLRAFLAAWPGPVVNRPTDTCLNGPGWRPEQWAVAIAAAGLPVRPVRRPAPPPAAVESTQVTVVGERWFGAVDDDLGWGLVTLAKAAGCTLMRASVDPEGTVLDADAWPDVSAPEVADALEAVR